MSFARKPFSSSAVSASKTFPVKSVPRGTLSSRPQSAVQVVNKSDNKPLHRTEVQGAILPVRPSIKSSSAARMVESSRNAAEPKLATKTELWGTRSIFDRLAGHHTVSSSQKNENSKQTGTRAHVAATRKDVLLPKLRKLAVSLQRVGADVSGVPGLKTAALGGISGSRKCTGQTEVKTNLVEETDTSAADISSQGALSGPELSGVLKSLKKNVEVSADKSRISRPAVPVVDLCKPLKSGMSTRTSTPADLIRPAARLADTRQKDASNDLLDIKSIIAPRNLAEADRKSRALALAVSLGLTDQDISYALFFLRRYNKSNRNDFTEIDVLLKVMELLADPISVVAASGGNFRPTGMSNPENVCFLNAPLQAIMSSANAVGVLSSVVAFSEVGDEMALQRAALAAIASVASDGNISADVFLGRFFPKMKDGKHGCANEFMNALFQSATSAVAIAQVSTAELRGRAKLHNLINSAVVLGNMEDSSCLFVEIYPHFGDLFNWNSVDFEGPFFSLQQGTFELKAAVFWEGLGDSNGKAEVDKGHYWAVAKRDGRWFRFNDRSVVEVAGPEQFCTLSKQRHVLVSLLYDRVHFGHTGVDAGHE